MILRKIIGLVLTIAIFAVAVITIVHCLHSAGRQQ